MTFDEQTVETPQLMRKLNSERIEKITQIKQFELEAKKFLSSIVARNKARVANFAAETKKLFSTS